MPVTESGCWIWMRSKTNDGYGQVGFKGKTWRTHRFSYTVYIGTIPDKMHVLHKCDTPLCVNPDHLEIGTNHDNICDRVRKGRSYRHDDMSWEKNYNCDRTPRLFLHSSYGAVICTRVYLTKLFGIDPSSMSKMLSGKVKSVGGWIVRKDKLL